MLIRLRAELLRRERNASWVREVAVMSEFLDMGGYGKLPLAGIRARLRHRGAHLVLALDSLTAPSTRRGAAWR